MNQENTPLVDALIKHRNKKPISLHVPGHKNGAVFPKEYEKEFNSILNLDVTELSGLDDLHSPSGAIYEAEDLLADCYAVKKSFFLINGSTVGNLAMILAAVKEEEVVLVQRNCHKSIMNALSLANARPVFITPQYHSDWQVAGGLTLKSVQEAINLYPKAKALVLTYPNYYGMTTDLENIITYCHAHRIMVLVDEAHGAHFGRSSFLPRSATELGADVVVQSAHKTLPAMTMGSFLHYNSELVDLDKLVQFLRMLQSSSPSYPIMASLDLARRYIATYKEEDMAYTMDLIKTLKSELDKIPTIKVLSYTSQKGDPLKITIQSRTNLSGIEIQERLEAFGIYSELADVNNVLFIFPLLKKDTNFPVNNIVQAFREGLEKDAVIIQRNQKLTNKRSFSTLQMSYKEQEQAKSQFISIWEANERICAESIVPYPPGVPLLLPGEVIRNEHIQQLNELLDARSRFQGGEQLGSRKIKYLTNRVGILVGGKYG